MARQDEYDREFLEYEDPAIYKALMQQEASEQRSTIGDGTMVQNLPDNVYESGKGRRAVASALGNIIGDDYATGLIGGGAVGKVPYGTKDLNKYAGLGVLDAVGVGGAIDFVDSWKFFNKINAEKTRVENELIEEGYDKNSELFDDEVTKRMPEYHGKGEAFFYSLLAPLEIATFGQASKMVAGGRVVKNALNKKIDTISRKLMSLKGAPGALPVVADTTSGALPSGNLSDNIQAIQDSASKLRSEKGALPVSSKPTVAELRREANIQKFGYDPNDIVDTSYRMQHTPNPEGARLDDMTGGGEVFPDDIYSSQGLRYYGNPNNKFDRESFEIIQEVRGNPDAEVTIYRAVPDKAEIDLINSGDFVTLSRDYAEMHGAGGYGVDGQQAGKILSKKVKVKDLFSEGNDLNEFGYFPQKETDDLTDSIKALRDSAKKLNFRS